MSTDSVVLAVAYVLCATGFFALAHEAWRTDHHIGAGCFGAFGAALVIAAWVVLA